MFMYTPGGRIKKRILCDQGLWFVVLILNIYPSIINMKYFDTCYQDRGQQRKIPCLFLWLTA